MKRFKVYSDFSPTIDQKKAIDKLSFGIEKKLKAQVLLGVTGSGKTYTLAKVIENVQRPALVISHNKTLAAQLYQEMRDFFRDNAVCYFVSYYDYYQPEAYIPSTDTFIEKDAKINDLIDKLRLATTTNLLTRKDVIVVASVSCIYNLGSPKEYGSFVFEFKVNDPFLRESFVHNLIRLQYERSDFEFKRGAFRVRGDVIDVFPSYLDEAIRIRTTDKIEEISTIDPVSGEVLEKKLNNFVLYPAKHFLSSLTEREDIFKTIKKDMHKQEEKFKKEGKFIEAKRIRQRVLYDIEMIKEVGYVKGIENYSRYFDGRKEGEPPFTLLDYFSEPFGDDWIVFIDESHMTIPQLRGMYEGDYSRKKVLVEYGFRLPAAFDNRPLKFNEFLGKIPLFVASSATPDSWELEFAKKEAKKVFGLSYNGVAEQLVRPTGIPDPAIVVKSARGQVEDLVKELEETKKKGERALITTLTKRTAEDLAEYLKEKGFKVHYLHSEIKTLERSDILDALRKGEYDCLVGINLLREGLDLPEVSLVAILDADKEGFLRSYTSLIQTMGRAARHINGKVILYADFITQSIRKAIEEVERRRRYQLDYNRRYNIKPTSIKKPIREKLIESEKEGLFTILFKSSTRSKKEILNIDKDSLTPFEKKKLKDALRREMLKAAKNLDFELAIAFRDKIKELDK